MPISANAAINLAWDAVEDSRVALYEVWYGTGSLAYDRSVVSTETTVTVDGLDSNKDYFFAVRACDVDRNQCSDFSDEIGATVSASNSPPNAVNDTATVLEDSSDNLLDVLANDTDTDGQALIVTAARAGHATVAINNDGTLSYSPNLNFNGTDTLSYTVSDGAGGTDSANATVNVSPVNDAPQAHNDTATVLEDSTGNTLDVLANDTDLDGDALSIAGASAVKGTAAVNADGTLSYSPAGDFNGTDIMTYTVKDGAGATASATVTVSVTAVNDAPVAVDDTATVEANSAANVLAVLANDVDVDGDELTVGAASANNGIASINTDGTLSYSPNADFVGTDMLVYEVSDGNDAKASATVTIEVAAVVEPLVAGFTASVATGEAPLTVLFSDTSTGSIQSRDWQFGDTQTATDATDVSHTYSEAGTYTVSLTVADVDGNTDEHIATDLIVVVAPVEEEILQPQAEPFDLSGDGKADLVLRHTKNNKLHLWEMSHDVVQNASDIDRLNGRWIVAGIGDFGGDGLGDLLLKNSKNGELEVWEMQGNLAMPSAVPNQLPLDWQIVGVGDFGGDGMADILLRNSQSGLLKLWEMEGNLPFESDISALDPAWDVVGTGDFGGDGMADILLRDGASGSLRLWEMDGNWPTQSEIDALDPAWDVAGIGDFGGDGRSDILLRHNDTHELRIWEMEGSVPSPSSVGPVEHTWAIVQVSDFGGDGRADILLQDTSNSTLHLFELVGNVATYSPMGRLNNYHVQPAEE
jgi:PKD repeat protein